MQEDVERGGSTDGPWMNGDVDSARFGNFLKRLRYRSRVNRVTQDVDERR